MPGVRTIDEQPGRADADADARPPRSPPDAPPAASTVEDRGELHRFGDALLQRLEAERERVSTHLHAEIEPLAISVKLLIEDATHRLGDAAPEVSALLAEVPGRLRALIEDLRRTANELRPNLFDEHGLLAALAWQCDRFAHEYPDIGVVRRLTAHDAEVPPAARLDILRIVEEALGNVARHSGASWVRVGLYREGDSLHLIVEDNGSGNAGAAPGAGGLGLALVRRRAQRSGARLLLRGQRGQGTQLHASWKSLP